jgi:acetolactate synthase-1/2/3 large subunit
MGLGAYPASGKNWLGMLGMHGLYEANLAMHDCDLMINIGARFDDRITGRIDAFSPASRKAHIDIDPSSINKVIRVDFPIVGDVAHVLEDVLKIWKARGRKTNRGGAKWWHADRGVAQGRLPGLHPPRRRSSRSTRWPGWRR